MNGNWGYFMQGCDQEIDELGSELSKAIHCPVHYPAFGKRLFECQCGVVFPVYIVSSRNWELMKKKHTEERKYLLV